LIVELTISRYRGEDLGVIHRLLAPRLRALARKFPVVTVTGPRQSGKTTLCRSVFPRMPYASLEAPDVQAFAHSDPRGFLAGYPKGAILDEVQRVPELLSYVQADLDVRPAGKRFVLTGSANFALLQSIGQSLAGRTALLNLLPLSLKEVRRFPASPTELFDVLWRGSYPALFDRGLDPGEWYASYVGSYVERDVRMVLAIGDLVAFQTFVRLCAGRVGQLVNLSALGADAGVTHATARAWLSVLEAGYLLWRLPPLHSNLGKRLVKAPKLHFLDTGLVCYLLGIRSPAQLREHPLRGAIFETWVASEILKARVHRALPPSLTFFRDRAGAEVDLVLELGRSLFGIETKSGQTVAEDYFAGLKSMKAALGPSPARKFRSVVVYGGDQAQRRAQGAVVPWSAVDSFAWWEPAEVRPRAKPVAGAPGARSRRPMS
jgi:predicted AAA+ superfamily ATPase